VSDPIIRVVDVKKSFGGGKGGVAQAVLRGVSLDIQPGELVALVGQSGSGKSTLLNIIGGLDTPDSGKVMVLGLDYAAIDDRTQSQLRNQRIGFIFQSFHLLEHMNVLENVVLPAHFAGKHGEQGDVVARGRVALERVGLAALAERRPAQLSGGQKQRVAIARALFNQPQLLLCDEPTGNLDSETGREVIELFQKLHQEGLTLLIVTHEERVAQVAQRVLRIADGHLVDHGRSVELRA
jgi:putative ABC transport system ATP-binding protein